MSDQGEHPWFGTNAATGEDAAPEPVAADPAEPTVPDIGELMEGQGTNAHTNMPGLAPGPDDPDA